MSENESSKQKDIALVRDFFRNNIDRVKKVKTISETKMKLLDDNRSIEGYMDSRWSWTLAFMIYDELLELWDFLESVSMSIIESEYETTNFKEQIKTLNKELKKHKPALLEFERIINEGKRELRRFK